MGVAITLKEYLDLHGNMQGEDPDSVNFSHTDVIKAAQKAHVPLEKIAKCVMLEDESGYVMAVCPVSSRLRLGNLSRETHRHLHYASEQELAGLQGNPLSGAVPASNEVYDIEVVVDDALLDKPDIYIEASEGKGLVHVKSDDLQHLIQNAEHAAFSQPI
jgi:Ala-tRNA(Pro) deacylase